MVAGSAGVSSLVDVLQYSARQAPASNPVEGAFI